LNAISYIHSFIKYTWATCTIQSSKIELNSTLPPKKIGNRADQMFDTKLY
jgi:hypothetical protein